MFCIVTNGRYWIVDENVFNNSQNIVLTSSMVASMANILVQGVVMK